jgi:hypothetical protein
MMPKVGQLLRWYDHFDNLEENNDIGIVKEVQIDARDENVYEVIVDWCKGPHSSWHDSDAYEESIVSGEIVVVE